MRGTGLRIVAALVAASHPLSAAAQDRAVEEAELGAADPSTWVEMRSAASNELALHLLEGDSVTLPFAVPAPGEPHQLHLRTSLDDDQFGQTVIVGVALDGEPIGEFFDLEGSSSFGANWDRFTTSAPMLVVPEEVEADITLTLIQAGDFSAGLEVDYASLTPWAQGAPSSPDPYQVVGAACLPSPPTTLEAWCGGLRATVVGTPGSDVLCADGGAVVVGLGGDDTIIGGDGAQAICGNGGRDTLDAGAGDDLVRGGRKGDVVVLGPGADIALTGRGADEVEGGKGPDSIWTGKGADTVHAGSGSDCVALGRGDDFANGGPGDDWLRGQGGVDVVWGDDPLLTPGQDGCSAEDEVDCESTSPPRSCPSRSEAVAQWIAAHPVPRAIAGLSLTQETCPEPFPHTTCTKLTIHGVADYCEDPWVHLLWSTPTYSALVDGTGCGDFAETFDVDVTGITWSAARTVTSLVVEVDGDVAVWP